MKKIYLFLSAALIASSGFAQLSNGSNNLITPGKSKTIKTFSNKDVSKSQQNSTKASTSNWFDYTSAYANLFSSTPYGLIGNNLFPDSTILVDYGTSGYQAPWIHGIGQTFDVDATPFVSQGIAIDPSLSFTIDSLDAIGIYTRVDNSVIDTLVFQVIAPSANNLGGVSYFPDTPSAGDTIFMINTDWDFASLSTPGVTAEYKVILDSAFYADSTANGLHIPAIAAGAVIPSATGEFAGVFAVHMEFRPGYTWVANDTLDVNKNAWWFGSYELQGQASTPNNIDRDYNQAMILPMSVRYNENTNGWNDSFISHWGYNSFSYESMAINAYITGEQSTIGINELNNNVKFNVYPNPSAGVFNINIASNEANNVSLSVKNIVGQTIMNETVSVSGNTNHTISLADYSKGVYFLTVDQETVKLIVE